MFEVGKEVVAIRDHSQGRFKTGDVFTLRGIKQGCCSQSGLHLDIGLFTGNGSSVCCHCETIDLSNIFWFNSKSFAPLDDISISELTEVLEKEPFEL
mgnify:CR=1 FL=1